MIGPAPVECHLAPAFPALIAPFRAIGVIDYLENGGDTNIAKRMAWHFKSKTTELYHRAAVTRASARLSE